MSEAAISIPKFIAMRYVRVGKRSHLVSFMSAISIVGLSLGVGILITVLCASHRSSGCGCFRRGQQRGGGKWH